jgi:hypothetical protein
MCNGFLEKRKGLRGIPWERLRLRTRDDQAGRLSSRWKWVKIQLYTEASSPGILLCQGLCKPSPELVFHEERFCSSCLMICKQPGLPRATLSTI